MKILTFDIEEWFHLLDFGATKTEAEWSNYPSRIDANMERIFDFLQKSNQKATFFCLGWVAQKYPHIIKAIANQGYEIGTHSHMHQLAYEQDRKAYTADLQTSIKYLEDITSQKVRAYRAPGFSIKQENKWAFEAMASCGIEVDCSVFPALRAHGGFAEFDHAKPCIIESDGIRLREFPINTFQWAGSNTIFSGGGYFRLLPYGVISYLSRKTDYVMTYFHPRDFDYEQPVLEGLSAARRFKSYVGLKNCLPKLAQWVNDEKFVDLQTAENQIDWGAAKVVKI